MRKLNRDWLTSAWEALRRGQLDSTDLDWYARDAAGHLALLTTAGSGPVLRAVVRDLDAYIAAVEHFWRLPTLGPAVMLPEARHHRVMDDWRQAAERGVYAFDHRAGAYRLVARPSVPLVVTELPAELQKWLDGIRLERVRFAECGSEPLDLW
jgi:hypothetical protein